MNDQKTVEQFFSELRGSMDVVVEACGLLVAKHPEKGAILYQLSRVGGPILGTDSSLEKHYKRGVLRALASIGDRVNQMEAQIQAESIKPENQH